MGNFSWGSKSCTCKTRIIGVYNASSNELVHTKALVKNCIMLIDSTLDRQRYESHHVLSLGHKTGVKLTPKDEETLEENCEEI